MRFSLLLVLLLLIGGCSNHVMFDEVVLVYCPTMSVHLDNLEMNNISLIKASSTREALSILRTGKANIALVGRLSYIDEVPFNFKEIVLFDRFTFVSLNGGLIQEQELYKRFIYTSLSAEEVKPFDFNFVFYDSFDEAVNNDYLFFIKWTDFDGSLKLVNVMHNDEKVEMFRNPVLYFHPEFEKQAELITNKILLS